MSKAISYRGLLRTGGMVSIIRALGAIAAMAALVVATRSLGPTAYGQYAYLLICLEFAAILALFGADTLVMRELASFRSGVRSTQHQGVLRFGVWRAIRNLVLIAPIVFLGIFLLSEYSRFGGVKSVAVATVGVLSTLTFLNLSVAALRGLGASVLSALGANLLRPTGIFLGIAMVWLAHGEGVALWWALAINFISTAGVAVYQWRTIGGLVSWPGRIDSRQKISRDYSPHANSFGVLAVVRHFTSFAEVSLVAGLLSMELAGAFVVAKRLSGTLGFALSSLNYEVVPLLATNASAEGALETRAIVRKARLLATLIIVPAAILIVVIGKPLLALFGDEYKVAFGGFIALCVGEAVNASFGPIGAFHVMRGRQNLVTAITGLGALVAILMNLVLVPRYGIFGAGLASTISIGTINILFYARYRRESFWRN